MAETAKPRRIQRKRSKGWRMPDNTVYVGRGSKWGNPWFLDNGLVKIKADNGVISIKGSGDIHTVVKAYADHLYRELRSGKADISELRGKNLACWCPPDQPCHADVLLEIAYRGQ